MDNKEAIVILKSFIESELADGGKVTIYEKDLEAIDMAIEALKNQEAEKERIIKELKSEFKKYYGDNWDKAPYLINAIEIVKSGGKE